jgi:hypothetical protein
MEIRDKNFGSYFRVLGKIFWFKHSYIPFQFSVTDRYPRYGMEKYRSGINIPDLQHRKKYTLKVLEYEPEIERNKKKYFKSKVL